MPAKPPQTVIKKLKLFGGVVFLFLSAGLLLFFFAALIASSKGIVALAAGFLICLALSFYLLDGPAEWRVIKLQSLKDSEQTAVIVAQEKQQSEQVILAQLQQQAKVEQRRLAITAWRMPSNDLFDVCVDQALNQELDETVPCPHLRPFMTVNEATLLLGIFRQDPRFNWLISLSHCEARADLMAEIAAEHRVSVRKIWVIPKDLDRGTIVTGWEGKVSLPINEAATEFVSWNFHVAILADFADGKEARVLDPTFFAEPVTQKTWCDRMSYGKTPVRFEVTNRFAYSDPYDANGENNRVLSLKIRNAVLKECFNIENAVVRNGLEMTLRAEYVDSLKRNNQTEFNQFISAFEQVRFKIWWHHRPDFERFEQLISNQHYFGWRIDAFRQPIETSSFELRNFELKKRCWRQVAASLLALEAHPDKSVLGDMDFDAWYEPDSQKLWRSRGFEFPSVLI
jgi:hypothetical protein